MSWRIKASIIGIGGLLHIFVCTFIASILFLYINGLWNYYIYSSWPVAWWFYFFNYYRDLSACPYLILTGIISFLIPTFVVGDIMRHTHERGKTLFFSQGINQVRPVERGKSDNYGHSRWRDMKDAQRLFPNKNLPRWGGIVVGEAYRVDQDKTVLGIPFVPGDKRTWGRGGKEPLLIDSCVDGSGHSLVFSGTGTYKTMTAVSSVLTWSGSSVIMDPSTEMGPMLDRELRRRGKNVVHIGIDNGEFATGFNVLSWIDINHPEAELHVQSVVGWIYDEAISAASRRGEDPFFAPMGRQLITCLLADLIWSDPDKVEISLATFADGLALPENDLLALLKQISYKSRSPLARRIAATLSSNTAPETFAGVALNATKGCGWLFTSVYADMVSRGHFEPEMLLSESTTVFLNISLRTLETTPSLIRVLVGALLNTVYMADGRINGKILFLIDEAARLGHLSVLETARDTGRKYSVCLHMLWQSVGQMVDIWGQHGTRAWIDACSWIGYASIRAAGAGKDLSHDLGSYSVVARSQGDNRGRQRQNLLHPGTSSQGTNSNANEISRMLATAAELQQDLRGDEIIIVPANGLPIRCGRAIYFRRPEFVSVVDRNRFSQINEVVNG
jgi:type IV secretion system protein VirD4